MWIQSSEPEHSRSRPLTMLTILKLLRDIISRWMFMHLIRKVATLIMLVNLHEYILMMGLIIWYL